MRAKTLSVRVDNCAQCPYGQQQQIVNNEYLLCLKTRRFVKGVTSGSLPKQIEIPSWCPLEDWQEVESGK